ncbi:DUF2786 domain-containing protein [Tautonia sociabilis]|nr:DUF2786 domain-containing protein [Tautonia sociabilis]
MSERPKEDVIDRVRRLLAKTEENGCTRAEAESAFRMASRIMAEHNIAMAEVEARDGRPDDISWLEDDVIDTGRWSLEMNLAYGIVREFFFVEGFFVRRTAWAGEPARGRGEARRGQTPRKVLRFFGTATNVEAARFTFTALIDAFDRLFAEHRRASGCAASERRLFVSGVAQGFAEKMRDERRAMEIERDLAAGRASGSTAIVLASVQERTVRAYKEAHPDMKKSRTTFAAPRRSQSSLDAGYAAGRSLSLNRALGGGSAKGNAKELPDR